MQGKGCGVWELGEGVHLPGLARQDLLLHLCLPRVSFVHTAVVAPCFQLLSDLLGIFPDCSRP